MTTTLIVDDEEDMRILLRLTIEMANDGLSIVGEAADGEEALEAWGHFEPPIPDVVVLDNRMPKLTGIQVAERILDRRPEQVVILYSAFMDERLRAEASRVGVAACLTKADIATLPDTIRSLAG